jgi:radical SAM superfamily enzyme YgiQ (UPF0313 family)
MNKTKVKLIYPAQQFELSENPRPDGSLGLLYLAGKLRDSNYDVSILDMCVGDENDSLDDTFFNRVPLDDTHIRVGMSDEKLKSKLDGVNIVGVTSIFTPQTHNCFDVAKVVKDYSSDILTIAGGGNARALYEMFLDNGFDIVVFGEGEDTLLEIVENFEKGLGFENIKNVAYKKDNDYIVNPERPALRDLDELPIPAWDMLCLDKYWQIGEPHGGTFKPNTEVRYLSMQTSRGCPFSCQYCHISKEGDASKLRMKSFERVMQEVDLIKSLGAEYLFFEDDSLLAKKDRIKTIFKALTDKNLKIIDVNGVNLAHFFVRDKNKELVVDTELLDLMVEVGWVEIAYPFESGNQRILNKYASRKWNKKSHDVKKLVELSVERGLKISGFFTIGYPDETYEELTETFLFAQELFSKGLNIVAFYIIVPYPGSVLYDYAVQNSHLPDIPDLSNMKFAVPTMVNTAVSPQVLKYTRRLVYELINSKEQIKIKHGKNIGNVATNEDVVPDLANISGRDLSLGI